jgi:hypothetical protein
MCDDLNQNIKKDLKTKFELHGGKIHSLNRIKWWNIFYKFKMKSARHHEKVISIDNINYIGSANINDKYTNIKYGSSTYWDLNYKLKNQLGREVRKLFY